MTTNYLFLNVSASKNRSHNGICPRPFPVFRTCLGHKYGEYVFTKKTGAIIHKSKINTSTSIFINKITPKSILTNTMIFSSFNNDFGYMSPFIVGLSVGVALFCTYRYYNSPSKTKVDTEISAQKIVISNCKTEKDVLNYFSKNISHPKAEKIFERPKIEVHNYIHSNYNHYYLLNPIRWCNFREKLLQKIAQSERKINNFCHLSKDSYEKNTLEEDLKGLNILGKKVELLTMNEPRKLQNFVSDYEKINTNSEEIMQHANAAAWEKLTNTVDGLLLEMVRKRTDVSFSKNTYELHHIKSAGNWLYDMREKFKHDPSSGLKNYHNFCKNFEENTDPKIQFLRRIVEQSHYFKPEEKIELLGKGTSESSFICRSDTEPYPLDQSVYRLSKSIIKFCRHIIVEEGHSHMNADFFDRSILIHQKLYEERSKNNLLFSEKEYTDLLKEFKAYKSDEILDLVAVGSFSGPSTTSCIIYANMYLLQLGLAFAKTPYPKLWYYQSIVFYPRFKLRYKKLFIKYFPKKNNN